MYPKAEPEPSSVNGISKWLMNLDLEPCQTRTGTKRSEANRNATLMTTLRVLLLTLRYRICDVSSKRPNHLIITHSLIHNSSSLQSPTYRIIPSNADAVLFRPGACTLTAKTPPGFTSSMDLSALSVKTTEHLSSCAILSLRDTPCVY